MSLNETLADKKLLWKCREATTTAKRDLALNKGNQHLPQLLNFRLSQASISITKNMLLTYGRWFISLKHPNQMPYIINCAIHYLRSMYQAIFSCVKFHFTTRPSTFLKINSNMEYCHNNEGKSPSKIQPWITFGVLKNDDGASWKRRINLRYTILIILYCHN